MKKRIKSSQRGLTFSLTEEEIPIGTHYRYIVDTFKKQVYIIPDEEGKLKVSKKKTGNSVKPLFDLRSKEVRDLVASADYLEVETENNQITVTAYRKTKARFRLLKNKICSIDEVLGIKAGTITLPLGMVSGSENIQYGCEKPLQIVSEMDRQTNIPMDEIRSVYDVVSLFSGAGLFDKAWLDTGKFRFVYANDFCEEVRETYEYNIGKHMHCKDIRDVRGEELPFADVFSASPCCQAFSNCNRRNMASKEAEEKRLLVEEVVRLVREAKEKPKVVVVENVPQMITKEKGLYLSKLIDGLQEYDATVKVVEDYKVGGYSLRKRCVVILSCIGKIELPDIEVLPYKTVRDALSKVDSTWYNYNDFSQPKDETIEKMKYVPQGGNWRDIPSSVASYGPETHSAIMRRLAWDEIAPTITNVRKNNIMPPEGNRCLSISEAAALMGLGKDFRFLGKLSAMQQSLGNGVTQAIGKLIARTVGNNLDNFYGLANA